MHALEVAVAATVLFSPLHADGHRFAQHVDDTFAFGTRVPILALRTLVITPGRLLIGREVSVRDVHVARVDRRGFWISDRQSDDEIFVLPAEGSLIGVSAGDIVSLRGEIRQTTDALRQTLRPATAWDGRLYIYAYVVRPTGISDYRATASSVSAGSARSD